MSGDPISVLIVDDSAVVRQTLVSILEKEEGISVMGVAADPVIARDLMKMKVPDVIILDIEMPRMDGLTFLQKIMAQRPIPTVICSTLTEGQSVSAQKAMDYGAVEIITKPRIDTRVFLEESSIRIVDAVKAAHMSKLKIKTYPMQVTPKYSADVILPKKKAGVYAMAETTEKVVLIGASTGGVEALTELLTALPEDMYGMVIVQHMPENFTRQFSSRLNELCRIQVKEAVDGDTVRSGLALIAPGNKHTLLHRSGARYYVEVRDGPLVTRHRPSVDVLFRSGARYAGANGLGILLTGMGDDGAQGLLELKESGAYTVAQDEKTCVVFGMPKEAINRNAAIKVLPLQAIAPFLEDFQRRGLSSAVPGGMKGV
jgi:two-component system chemotaxis response regulator CheB